MASFDLKNKVEGKHTEPGFKLSHIKGDMGRGSTGTRPHDRVCNLIRALFFVQNETERDQTEVRAKLTSAAKIYIKAITHFCFPESSFGVTSTKLYRANVGQADLSVYKQDFQLLKF